MVEGRPNKQAHGVWGNQDGCEGPNCEALGREVIRVADVSPCNLSCISVNPVDCCSFL